MKQCNQRNKITHSCRQWLMIFLFLFFLNVIQILSMHSIQVLTIRSWWPLELVRSLHNLSKNFSRSGMTESLGCPATNETNKTNGTTGTRDLTFERWQWICIMEIKTCKCTYCICWISHFMFFIVAFSWTNLGWRIRLWPEAPLSQSVFLAEAHEQTSGQSAKDDERPWN